MSTCLGESPLVRKWPVHRARCIGRYRETEIQHAREMNSTSVKRRKVMMTYSRQFIAVRANVM